MTHRLTPWFIAACLAASRAFAAEGAGTLADPIRIDAFPYAHASDTTGRASEIDGYSCAPAVDEGGPEVLYRFSLAAAGRVTAWVEGDVGGSVDIDVHVSADIAVSGREARCLARGNLWAEADLPAGEGWVSVDTYVSAGRPLPGPYVLRVDYNALDEMRERVVARGVQWRQRLYPALFGGAQTVNILDVDPAAPGLSLKPATGSGCETISSIGARVGATAGVNAGFFDGSCAPVGLVRIDDRFLASNPWDRPPRSALGIGDAGPLVERIPAGDGWTAVHQALGGLPQLVHDGAEDVLWAEEEAGESFATSRHPRTAACISTAGHVLFVTFDGRTAAGLGVGLSDLATYLIWIGCDDGLNYDGGGSTTMWIDGQPASGVVSYPSDDAAADHLGSRAVSNGWFVRAEPYDNPPRFTTEPVLSASDGTAWTYDADALDLELQPLVFSLGSGPAGMTVDPATGVATWLPGYRDGGPHDVTLGVSDGANLAEQAFVVVVSVRDRDGDTLPDAWEEEYGTDPDADDAADDPDADGYDNAAELALGSDPLDPLDPAPGADADADADARTEDGGTPQDAADAQPDVPDGGGGEGCSCRVPEGTPGSSPVLPAALLAIAAILRRRRSTRGSPAR